MSSIVFHVQASADQMFRLFCFIYLPRLKDEFTRKEATLELTRGGRLPPSLNSKEISTYITKTLVLVFTFPFKRENKENHYCEGDLEM